MSQFRIALVQPLTSPPLADEKNVAAAVASIATNPRQIPTAPRRAAE